MSIDDRRSVPGPIPNISGRDEPRYGSRERKEELAKGFLGEGAGYDELRPGYPAGVLDMMLAAVGTAARSRVVDLGAGTGKLALALADRGCRVTALDTSASMLEVAREKAVTTDAKGRLEVRVAQAEATTLPPHSADLVTAAQAWHWFERDAVSAEVQRILAPGGVLALVWNTLDVSVPWVHRYSRIAHAGDVQREGFLPDVGEGLELVTRYVEHWTDARPTWDFVHLATTRSYYLTAAEKTRAKVLENLDWYFHEHLGYEAGSAVAMPYRTDLFLYRVEDRERSA
ncbi:type 11 methyltransferase [Mycobacteroides abscessus subsp. abscessus]|nr:type 11 methyltransferase [Mycobacteroides abscessus subsp. abscessus]